MGKILVKNKKKHHHHATNGGSVRRKEGADEQASSLNGEHTCSGVNTIKYTFRYSFLTSIHCHSERRIQNHHTTQPSTAQVFYWFHFHVCAQKLPWTFDLQKSFLFINPIFSLIVSSIHFISISYPCIIRFVFRCSNAWRGDKPEHVQWGREACREDEQREWHAEVLWWVGAWLTCSLHQSPCRLMSGGGVVI